MRLRKKAGERKDNCSKCNELLEDNRKGKYRYCKKCHTSYIREHRLPHSSLSNDAKMKLNCRAYTKEYVKRGNLSKEPCYNCGSNVVQAHHSDYSNPTKVHWLCRECHLKLHSDAELEYKINSMPPSKLTMKRQKNNINLGK